jgi:hypothetical protein
MSVTYPWPAPPHREAFAGLAGEIVSVIEPRTEAAPVAVLLNLLAGVGNAMGNGPHVLADGAPHGGIIFPLFIGPTASGRKGTAERQARRFLMEADPTWYERCFASGLQSGEGITHRVRDPKPARGKIPEDPGASEKRLYLVESEFASVLARMRREASSLSETIRQCWDGTVLGNITKQAADTATEHHITITAHITTDELRRRLRVTEVGNGFLNRFLPICTRRVRSLPEAEPVPASALQEYGARLAAVIQFAAGVGRLDRNLPARQLWKEHYEGLTTGAPGLLGAVTSRGAPYVLRLGVIYAVLDQSRVITDAHLRSALAVWDYSVASAHMVFGDALGEPDADHLLAALKGAPAGLTKAEMYAVFGGHRTAGEIDAALDTLEEAALATPVVVPEAERGRGRPTERWVATANKAKKIKTAVYEYPDPDEAARAAMEEGA